MPPADPPDDPITDADPPPADDAAAEREIDEASEVTDADLDDAAAAWRRHAPPGWTDLLDAE